MKAPRARTHGAGYICQVCKEIYCVEREDNPSLSFKGGSQGFHQACYDRLEIGPSHFCAEKGGNFKSCHGVPKLAMRPYVTKIWGFHTLKKSGTPPALCYNRADTWGYFLKIVLGFRNLGYDFWGVGGDVLRWLCRHVRRKISSDVDGGLSGVSRCVDTGARTPIGVSGNYPPFPHKND